MTDEQKQSKQPQEPHLDPFILERLFPNPISNLKSPAKAVSVMATDCLFVLDANALIELYKVSQHSVAEISKKLVALQKADRLFFPARALQEFLKNRSEALRILFDDVHKRSSENPTYSDIKVPMLEACSEYVALRKSIEVLAESRKAYGKALKDLQEKVMDWSWNDPVSTTLGSLVSPQNVIHAGLTNEQIVEDTKRRGDLGLPPGYKDKTKTDLGVGDVMIWHSILKLGKERQRPIIFVTNETKADWVAKTQDVAIIARAELCGEYFATVSNHFGIVNLPRFLKLNQISPEAVIEVEQAATEPTRGRRLSLFDVEALFGIMAAIDVLFETNGIFNPYKLENLIRQLELEISARLPGHSMRLQRITKCLSEIFNFNDLLSKLTFISDDNPNHIQRQNAVAEFRRMKQDWYRLASIRARYN